MNVTISVGTTVDRASAKLLHATLEHTNWDKPRAAKILDVSLSTVYAWIRRHRLKPAVAAASRRPS